MKSLYFMKKVIALVLIVFSLSFMFQNSSFAQQYSSQEQPPVHLPSSSGSQSSSPTSQLDETEWEITSVPIRPLLPGFEWEVKSEQNGTKLIIKHGDEEALTLVKKALLQ